MKIFAVWTGQYSDARIEQLCSTRKIANAIVKKCKWMDGAYVEEYEVDKFIEPLKQGFQLFGVSASLCAGSDYTWTVCSFEWEDCKPGLRFTLSAKKAISLTGYVWAFTEEHAAKICNEKWAELKALSKWPTEADFNGKYELEIV